MSNEELAESEEVTEIKSVTELQAELEALCIDYANATIEAQRAKEEISKLESKVNNALIANRKRNNEVGDLDLRIRNLSVKIVKLESEQNGKE